MNFRFHGHFFTGLGQYPASAPDGTHAGFSPTPRGCVLCWVLKGGSGHRPEASFQAADWAGPTLPTSRRGAVQLSIGLPLINPAKSKLTFGSGSLPPSRTALASSSSEGSLPSSATARIFHSFFNPFFPPWIRGTCLGSPGRWPRLSFFPSLRISEKSGLKKPAWVCSHTLLISGIVGVRITKYDCLKTGFVRLFGQKRNDWTNKI